MSGQYLFDFFMFTVAHKPDLNIQGLCGRRGRFHHFFYAALTHRKPF